LSSPTPERVSRPRPECLMSSRSIASFMMSISAAGWGQTSDTLHALPSSHWNAHRERETFSRSGLKEVRRSIQRRMIPYSETLDSAESWLRGFTSRLTPFSAPCSVRPSPQGQATAGWCYPAPGSWCSLQLHRMRGANAPRRCRQERAGDDCRGDEAKHPPLTANHPPLFQDGSRSTNKRDRL
jgi:hypothetical protein